MAVKKTMDKIVALCKNRADRLIHVMKIRIRCFCSGLCLLQFNGRNELHRFGDLLRT